MFFKHFAWKKTIRSGVLILRGRIFAFSTGIRRRTLSCCRVYCDFYLVLLLDVSCGYCDIWWYCVKKNCRRDSVFRLWQWLNLCLFAACALGCSSCHLVVTTSKAYSSSCSQVVVEAFQNEGLKWKHIHWNTPHYHAVRYVCMYLLTVCVGNCYNGNGIDQVNSAKTLGLM